MPVTPTGAPAWVRNADHQIYGGHVDKTNYQSKGVVNPRTDLGAEALCRIAADLASAVRTGEFCSLTAAGTTVSRCSLMTGVTGSYTGSSPPTGFPAVAEVANGHYTVTFASSYSDPYSVSGAFTPVAAIPSVVGNAAAVRSIDYEIVGQVVHVYIVDGAGSGVAGAAFSLSVW